MRFVEEFGVNIVGGCCGTMPEHLKMLVRRASATNRARQDAHDRRQAAGLEPRTAPRTSARTCSYLIVAERTNTNGSRQFKRLLQEENWDGLVSMARDEVRDGSHMLDVCVDFVGRDGVRDMHEVVRRFVNAINAPLMLDSTNPAVMEAGLKLAGGRCVLNSMNLEDGEEKLGAHLRAGEEVRRRRRRRARSTRTSSTRWPARPSGRSRSPSASATSPSTSSACATRTCCSTRSCCRSAPASRKTAATRWRRSRARGGSRKELPKCHTVVGLSNVSFGLKPAARVVLNSAFLHELREAGLTGAIVHASKILPKNRIPDEQWNAALDLIYDRRREGFDPLTHFIGLFPDDGDGGRSRSGKGAYDDLPIEEKLKRHIIDGEKRHLHRAPRRGADRRTRRSTSSTTSCSTA